MSQQSFMSISAIMKNFVNFIMHIRWHQSTIIWVIKSPSNYQRIEISFIYFYRRGSKPNNLWNGKKNSSIFWKKGKRRQFEGLLTTIEILFIQQILYHPQIVIRAAATTAKMPVGVARPGARVVPEMEITISFCQQTGLPWSDQLICSTPVLWDGTKATPYAPWVTLAYPLQSPLLWPLGHHLLWAFINETQR